MLLPLILCRLAACTTVATAADRPNVLLILVDDLKPALGCYGDTVAQTPNIDRLAARGMRFDLAYCNQAVCAPSRFTLMLGSHSTSTGLYGLGSPLRQLVPNAVTMPQYFAKHGYRTESLGKVFHIGHGNHGDPESFSVPHFKEKVIEYADPASKPGGKLTREEAMFQNAKAPPGGMNSLPRGAAFESPDVNDDAYADGRVAMETIRRLQAAKSRVQPFFIVAGFARPHLPFSAPKKYWDLYDPADFELASIRELPDGSPTVAHKRGGEIRNYFPVPDKGDPAEISDELARKLIHGYYASTSYVDAQIGKVLDELNSSGQAKNTIVVLWGDHGFHLGDLGIWTKHTNYEQANRIPIIITAPNVTKPGSSTKQLAESVDIFPTLAELAGLPSPVVQAASLPRIRATGQAGTRQETTNNKQAGSLFYVAQPIDGVSLVPVLQDPEVRVRDHAYHAYPNAKLGRAIRNERYRLIEWRAFGDSKKTVEYELYDYETDPLETRNLAADKPDVVAALKDILARYPQPVGRNGPPARKNGPNAAANRRVQTDTPVIANRPITIIGRIESLKGNGVIVAQGGREHGYAVHILDGRLAFDVRFSGKVTRVVAKSATPESFDLKATLTADRMTLSLNGSVVGEMTSPGLITVQPKDEMSVARDDLSAAGDYTAPNPLDGKVVKLNVTTGDQVEQSGSPNISAGRAQFGDITKPLFADSHYNGSCDPEVIWNPHEKEWFIYYTARRSTRERATYVGTPLGVISSPDLVNWKFRGYCRLADKNGDGHKGQPDNEDTHWAPGIIVAGDTLHMFATYKASAEPPWGGDGVIRHYVAPLSDPVDGWKLAEIPEFNQPDPIDVSLLKVGDTFRAYYRVGKGGGIQWASSDDLQNWNNHGKCPGDLNASPEQRGFGYQEAPYVFHWQDRYWMLTDPHEGLAVFHSTDGIAWTQQQRILKEHGTGTTDATLARHPSVAVIGDRAFIFYHTEPNRPYPTPPAEQRTPHQKIAFLQMAELKVKDGILVCDRDAEVRIRRLRRKTGTSTP